MHINWQLESGATEIFRRMFVFFGNNLKLQDLQDFALRTCSIHLLQICSNEFWKVDPKVKMIIAFKEASSAMLVTQLGEEMISTENWQKDREKTGRSVTTCDSFYANCFSVIKVVRTFDDIW